MNAVRRRTAAIILFALTLAACAGSRRPDLEPAALAHLTLPDVPDAMVIVPDGSKAYVTARGKVYVVAPAEGTVVGTIALPPAPRALALSPDGKRLFVGDFADLQLSIIDTTRDSVVQRVPIGRDGIPWEAAPSVMAVSPDGDEIYIGTPGTSQLWAIDAADATRQRYAQLTMQPGAVSVAGANGIVYVAGCPQGCLKGEFGAYDPRSLQRLAALDLPAPAARTLIAPQEARAYVLERTANQVAVIDLRNSRLVATISIGNLPGDIALAPDASVIYATSFGDKRLVVIDTSTRSVVSTVPVPAGPRGISASADGRFVLVTAGLDGLIVFDAEALRRVR